MIEQGKITKNISNMYTVEKDNVLYSCQARGKFRKDKITPLVGDYVSFDSKTCYILDILPRKNELMRPNVANIDIAFIVTSLKEPDLSLSLLDKLLSMVIINKIEPVICLTKEDLLEKDEKIKLNSIIKYYENLGIKIFYNYEREKILKFLSNKVVVLAGQTGSGKSSLLNSLDETLNLNTSPISKALNRGVHTTRHIELFKIENVWFLDTPGFSALEINIYSNEEIKNSFIEFRNSSCMYKDCSHINTDGCEVTKKLQNNLILPSRYNNYCNFINKDRKKGE